MKARKQSGFTLIELIMVIAILGILAATAIPKFTDLTSEAGQAATDGVAGALGAASAINYAVSKAGGASVSVGDCDEVDGTLEGGLPTGYTITATVLAPNATATCSVSDGTNSADFTGHGVS